MKQIFVGLVFLFTACTESNTSGEKNNLSSLDSNTANNASIINTDEILVQGFTQIPSIINNCSALFVKDTTEQAQKEYVFVTNLKGLAFIKLNNRLMELKLIKQTNVDKYTVNELYVNDEVEIDLKIREVEEGKNAKWNYNGVLVIRRGAKKEAVTIAGKLGC